jgi:hypothetical protein
MACCFVKATPAICFQQTALIVLKAEMVTVLVSRVFSADQPGKE